MILRYFISDQDMSLVIVGDSGSWMKMWCVLDGAPVHFSCCTGGFLFMQNIILNKTQNMN